MIPVRWVRLACVAMFVVGLARVPAALGASAVEELSRRMPDEVIAFAGTSGGDALKGDFEKAILGRIWNDKGVQQFYQSIKTELVAKAKQESDDPNAAQKVDMVLNYVRTALSRPIVAGIVQAPVQDGPPIAGFVILDAGGRKAELTAMVSKLEAMAGQDGIVDKEVGSLKLRALRDSDDVPVYWGWAGNHFVIGVNDAQGAAVKYVSQPRTAAPAYLTKLPGNGDALALYGDYRRLTRLIETVVREESGQEDAGKLTAALKRLGLSELKSHTVRMGFSGVDMVAQSAIEMPVPATGVFAACKPVDLAWLRAVDARAVTASAVNWDLMSLYDTILGTIKSVAPEDDFAEIQEAISGFESEAKLRIRGDLLASLAGPAVSYVLPAGAVPEAPMGGFVVVAKLTNVAQFEKAMTALGEFAAEQSGGMLQIGSQERDNGRTVHVWTIAPLAMTGMMPTWSVVSDHVIMGSSQELCDRGVEQLVSKAADVKSLLDTEGYKKVAAGLPKNLTSFTYTDSQVQLNQTMMQMRQFWPMATMMAGQAGFKLPAMLPSLTNIAKDMGPSCTYSYSGPDGLYSYHRGPGIEVSLATVAGGAIGAGIALPAMAKAREQARITVSMNNLKQIGLALHMYAQDNNDKFASNLEQAKKYYGDAKILESPRKPKGFEGPSYIYIPDQDQKADPMNVLAYENPEFGQEKIPVLFLDGHVEMKTQDDLQSELEATYERLGRKMPGEESEEEEEIKA